MAVFDDLPVEIIELIFKNLNYRDLIQCRFVCKNWKCVCDGGNIVEKLIIKYEKGLRIGFFHMSNQRIEYENAIDCRTFLRSSAFFDLPKSLIKLHVRMPRQKSADHISMTEFFLTKINEFANLKHFEFLKFSISNIGDIIIKLPNLKIIRMDFCGTFLIWNKSQLILDCPRLEHINIEACVQINIINSSVVKSLQVYSKEMIKSDNQLVGFKNLESLSTAGLENINLEYLPKLKTYNIYVLNDSDISKFDDLMEYSFKNNRDFKFYLQNFEIKDRKMIQEHYNNLDCMGNYIIEYFSLYNNELPSCSINYGELHFDFYYFLRGESQKFIPRTILDELNMKLFKITSVYVIDASENQKDDFIELLSKLNSLQHLDMTDCDFDQSFYDHLCLIKKDTLIKLRVDLHDLPTHFIEINFECILNLRYLEIFKCRFKGSYEKNLAGLKQKAHENLKYLKEFII